jgi:hypothetical protein
MNDCMSKGYHTDTIGGRIHYVEVGITTLWWNTR